MDGRKVAAGLAVLALLCLIAMAMFGKARAQGVSLCGERAAILAQLAGKYHETRQAVGLVTQRMIAELYVSKAGTWTMLTTMANGKSCILAAGSSWEAEPTVMEGPEL